MRQKLLIFGLTILFIGVIIAISTQSLESQNDMVERGNYLVAAVAACGYCHTPRAGAEYNMDMYLAGHPATESSPRYNFNMMRQSIFLLTSPKLSAFSGPFGTSFASNLTPDKETGLGEWTEKMFIDAIRTGHHQGTKDNRKIFPPMQTLTTKRYAQMSDTDLKAIWAYLKSIKPVKNEVSPILNRFGRPF